MKTNVRVGRGQPLNKKAFTLIELLAVIVILAIIALIATPIILGIINDSKKQSEDRSAELYLDAAKKAIARYQANNPDKDFSNVTSCDIGINEIVCTDDDNNDYHIPVEISGQAPSGGTILLSKGNIVSGTTIDYGDNKSYEYTNGKLVLSDSTGEETCRVTTNKSFGNSCTYEDLDSSNGISVGDKVTCGTESFYVIENPSNGTVKMLAEWNLNVSEPGNIDGAPIEIPYSYTYCSSTEGYQDLHVRGSLGENPDESLLPYTYTLTVEYQGQTMTGPWPYGVVKFDSTPNREYGYWTTGDDHHLDTSRYTGCTGECNHTSGSSVGGYPAYVYDSNATLKTFVDRYVGYLNSAISGANATGRLISVSELEALGCSMGSYTCSESSATAPSWVYQTSYWSGSASDSNGVWRVNSDGYFDSRRFGCNDRFGVRPVIEVNTSVISAG